MRTIAAALLASVWLFPQLGIICEQVFSPFHTPIQAPGVGLLDSNRSLIFLLALGAFGLSLPAKIKLQGATPFTLAFLAWTVLSSLFGAHPTDSLFFSLCWFAAVMALVAGQNLLPQEFPDRLKIGLLHLPLVLLCLAAIIPLAADPNVDRISEPFGLANIYSNWMLMVLPFILLDFFKAEGRLWVVSCLSAGLGLLTLTMTYSRLGWVLACLQICAILLVLGAPPRRRLVGWTAFIFVSLATVVLIRARLGGVGFILSVLTITLLPPIGEALLHKADKRPLGRLAALAMAVALGVVLLGRMNPGKDLSSTATARMERLVKGDNSRRARLDFWRAAFLLSNEHPLLGGGPDSFATYYPRHQEHYYFYSDSPHNTTLELTSDLGWAGGLLFVLAAGTLIWRRRDAWTQDPLSQMALISIAFGTAQAQVDVTYQYTTLWITLALSGAILSRQAHHDTSPRWGAALALLASPLVLWLILLQRDFEIARRVPDEMAAYQIFRRVSDRLPTWSKPTLRALDSGLYLNSAAGLPLESLMPLIPRALQAAPDNATSHRLAGMVAMRQHDVERAARLLTHSLKLDPHNFPSTYHALMRLTTGNREATELLVRQVVEGYPVENLDSAYTSHRENLGAQLSPLFLDIADTRMLEGKLQEAVPLYRASLAHNASNPNAHLGLGIALRQLGQREEAREHLEKAYELNPAEYVKAQLDKL